MHFFDCYSVLLEFLLINAACSWRFPKVAISSSVSQTSMFHQAFEVMENIFFVCFQMLFHLVSGIFKSCCNLPSPIRSEISFNSNILGLWLRHAQILLLVFCRPRILLRLISLSNFDGNEIFVKLVNYVVSYIIGKFLKLL